MWREQHSVNPWCNGAAGQDLGGVVLVMVAPGRTCWEATDRKPWLTGDRRITRLIRKMRTRFLLRPLVFSASLFFGICPMSAAPSLLDPDLQVNSVIETGLTRPIAMAFLGPNDFLVAEKASGRVRRVVNGVVTATPLDLAVNFGADRGLLSIALSPTFATDRSVYLFWAESSTGADSQVLSSVPLLGHRVDRFIWNGASQTLTHAQTLLRLRAYQADNNGTSAPYRGDHNGGPLRSGPDGKLYVFVGDVGRRGALQNLPKGPFVPPAGDDDFGGPAPDNAHLTGAILRLNADGSTPTDNPFYGAGASMGGEVGANVAKVFSYGHRNSAGLAFDPYSGALWNSEHGDDSFDEINKIVAGGNYGWIQVMGPLSRAAQFRKIEQNLYVAPATIGSLQQNRYLPDRIAVEPDRALSRMYVLPGSVYQDPELSWRYCVPPGGLGFVEGNGLGPDYAGSLWSGAGTQTTIKKALTGEFANGFLMCLRLTPDRQHLDLSGDSRLADRVADNGTYPPAPKTNPAAEGYKHDGRESETLLIGQNFGIVTDIQTGPDGHLYLVSITANAVYKISAAGTP